MNGNVMKGEFFSLSFPCDSPSQFSTSRGIHLDVKEGNKPYLYLEKHASSKWTYGYLNLNFSKRSVILNGWRIPGVKKVSSRDAQRGHLKIKSHQSVSMAMSQVKEKALGFPHWTATSHETILRLLYRNTHRNTTAIRTCDEQNLHWFCQKHVMN